MQLHHAYTLEGIEAVADHRTDKLTTWPVTLDQWDFSTSNRDEVVALLAQSGHPKRTIWLVGAALAGGFGLGWAGAWYGPATISTLNPIAQIETGSHRMPDTKSGGKAESVRRTSSGSRTSPALGQPSIVGAIAAPKPLAKASSATQSAEASNLASSAVETDVSVTGSRLRGRSCRPPTHDQRRLQVGQCLTFAAERRCLKGPRGFDWQHGVTWSPASGGSILSCVGVTVG